MNLEWFWIEGYRTVAQVAGRFVYPRPRSRAGPFLGDPVMNPTSVIVRFDQVAEQAAGSVLRIFGFARAAAEMLTSSSRARSASRSSSVKVVLIEAIR